MPFTKKPNCSSCKCTNSNLWRKGSNGQTFCCNCARKELDGIDDTQGSESNSKTDLKDFSHLMGPVRKSSRIKPSRYKYQATAKPLATKGKSRRVIFKKNPIRAPASVATTVTSGHIFHDGTYWQIGDIASVMDDEGGIYYVQLCGFLQDQFCDKSAVITWLLPTTASTPGHFDPSTYIIGPEEDLPRSMNCFEFVMHAPSDYFHDKTAPYPTDSKLPQLGYIWTHLGPEIRRVPPREQIYGLQDLDSDDTSTSKENQKIKQEGEKRKKVPKERKRGRKAGKKVIPKVEPEVQIKEEPIDTTSVVSPVVPEKRKIRERGRKRKTEEVSS